LSSGTARRAPAYLGDDEGEVDARVRDGARHPGPQGRRIIAFDEQCWNRKGAESTPFRGGDRAFAGDGIELHRSAVRIAGKTVGHEDLHIDAALCERCE
jgi:hypothetical protein